MFDYFVDALLGMALPWSATLDLPFFHREGMDLSALDMIKTEDEVWDTIKSMSADRAPRPDRYTGRFYK
jgi:hypothetical protein